MGGDDMYQKTTQRARECRPLLSVEELEFEALWAEGGREECGEAGHLNLEQCDRTRYRKATKKFPRIGSTFT
jgi:hypothetical protein